MKALAEHGAMLLGGRLERAEPMAGGDLSGIAVIRLADGREAVVKSGPNPRAEAAMLEAIAASGAPVPAVLGVDDTALVIERLPGGGSLNGAWRSLGAALALLHSRIGTRYGFGVDYAFGRVAISNAWRGDWCDFWAEHRLLTHVADLEAGLGTRVERLAQALPELLPAAPEPVLLHGDLWGGNVLVAGRAVSALIDPACYYGHAEVDIAMLELFDRPPREFYETYGRLAPGHEERLAIYTLWPALVHLRLFGSGYAPLVERLLSRVGC